MSKDIPAQRGGAVARAAALAEKARRQKSKQQQLVQALQIEQTTDISPPEILLQLPLFPGEKSAIPHKWTRSSLFMSISAGHRKNYVKTKLASRNDLTIIYTGEQLDMADNDVFLHTLRLAQGRNAGEPIHFVRSQFLQAIGRSAGTTGYKWLKDSLQRLASATLFIENAEGDGKMFRLIKELSWTRNQEFWLALDPEIVQFFGRHELAHIDFQARLELKAPLAKWLQNYASGHRAGDWHCVAVENLRIWSGGGELRNFIAAGRGLQRALEELEAAGIINEFEFYTSKDPTGRPLKMVRWWRPSDFGRWLRNYALEQPLGWHQVSIETLFKPSQYRTIASFLKPSKGLHRALNELEKSGLIEKPEIYTDSPNSKVTKVRWWRSTELSTGIGIAEHFSPDKLA